MKNTLGICLLCIVLSGCASLDRSYNTRFEPIRTEGDSQIFKYTAFADLMYPAQSEEAERIRIQWLQTWLTDNGFDPSKSEVVSRKIVTRHKGAIVETHDIFYEVKAFR